MEIEDLAWHLSGTTERLVRWLRNPPPLEPLSSGAASILLTVQAEGAMRVTDIARSQGISQPATTQLIARLEKSGLLERHTGVEDRRAVLVRITPEGSDAVATRRQRRAERLRTHLDLLGPAERADIERALPALEALITTTSYTSTPEKENS